MSNNKVYVFVVDGGDGSASTCYTKDPLLLKRLEEEDPEYYGLNEGTYSDVFTFPEGLDLDACGFNFFEDDME